MISCKACGYDNPLGRVHCMQCGAKVDLSMVVTADQATGAWGEVIVKGGETTVSASVGQIIKKAISLAILAVLLVAGALMWQQTPIRDISTDAAHALAMKGRFDTLSQAQQDGKAMAIGFTEEEINSYLNDARSPKQVKFAPDKGGVEFPPRLTKYQIEVGNGRFTVIGVAEMRVAGFSKEITLRADGSFADGGDGKKVKWTRAFIGRLPLHALPAGDLMAGIFANSCFKLPDYDAEWAVLKDARTITLTPGKAVVSVGPATR